jgi:hypothetical protein
VSARAAAAKPKTTRAVSSAPVQLKSRPKEQAAREPLFSIDDIEYTMPVVVELGDSISLAQLLRFQPTEDTKGVELVRHLCGQQALNALMGDATMTRAEWQRIVAILKERAFGPEEAEDESGN